MAAMGGLWQAIVFGFAGLRPRRPDDRALVVDPLLPDRWQELCLRLTWHGVRVRLRCRNDAVHVASSAPISVVAGDGAAVEVAAPGRWVGVDRKEGPG
jgi:trehalose/maltose hydrolase-like predicted phosphorylase